MRKFTNREKNIINRIVEIHEAHPNIRIPVPVIYEKSVELKDDYEACRKEAIRNIVTNYNQSYIYETANLITVLEENGYILLDKEPKTNPYKDEIEAYRNYIKEMETTGCEYEQTVKDSFPLKPLFRRISPKFANMLLNQIYANVLVFDSLVDLAKDRFLTEEGQMLKEAEIQSKNSHKTLCWTIITAICALLTFIFSIIIPILFNDNKNINEPTNPQVNTNKQNIDTIHYIEYIVDEPFIDTTQQHIPKYKFNN